MILCNLQDQESWIIRSSNLLEGLPILQDSNRGDRVSKKRCRNVLFTHPESERYLGKWILRVLNWIVWNIIVDSAEYMPWPHLPKTLYSIYPHTLTLCSQRSPSLGPWWRHWCRKAPRYYKGSLLAVLTGLPCLGGGGYHLKGCHNCPEEKRNQEWQSNDQRISRLGNLTMTYVQLLFHALTRSQDPVPPQ